MEACIENGSPVTRSWFPTHWLSFGKASAAEKTPHIVHVDVDAFFASVEQVLNPKLRSKPVLVGRGVVASASYEAKSHGVKTAMTFREALRVCPQAVVVPGQYEHYADFAERVRRETTERIGLPCRLEVGTQTEFPEPAVRVNTDLVDVKALQWIDTQAWDEFAEYYRGLASV